MKNKMRVYPDKAIFGWEGDNGVGEMLINQIINEEKTATCSFKIEYTETDLKGEEKWELIK